MGGWTKYSITTKDFENKVQGSLAGIESVIDFYNKNKQKRLGFRKLGRTF
ncbi:hypothetical protein FACS189440_21190 [Bacteroidia bacterium]|nr:hypothetical protein FACS189440_21190 [Bacteroidia bacterium]